MTAGRTLVRRYALNASRTVKITRYVGQQLPQSVEREIAYGLSRDFSGTIDDLVTASRSLADT